MKKYLVACLFGLSLLMLAACGGGEENNTATDAPIEQGATAEAEKLFKQSCASCHGGNLEGGFGPKLEQVGNKYSAAEIEDIILNGQGKMQGGLLKGEEASTVASWLAEHK
ncbi:cytochrome c551 [Sutcliffiella halmapala]|uniref:cytochrome c551 n=1 Tax=Sutcliffiella halmapala TaxID=79882 RepID=UPI00099584E0|nr:c-type cytochrome [Sutcliffiella halmapala]